MILEELSKKNKKWLKMAYNLCGDYDLASELVQDMYLKIYDISQRHPEKELKDTYVWVVLTTLLNDRYRSSQKNKMVSLEHIKNKPTNDFKFELDDEDLKIIEKSKELRYLYRYYLEKNYDYSIREIADINNVNYGKVYLRLKHAREHILGDDIHKYKNKRRKR